MPILFDLDTDITIANNVGADEPGTVRFSSSLDGQPSGLTSNGVSIVYDVSDEWPDVDGARQGNTSVFVITLDPAGWHVYDRYERGGRRRDPSRLQ